MNYWWRLSVSEVSEKLGTNPETGLSSEAYIERLVEFGANELQDKQVHSPFKLFLSQFEGLVIWVLIGAAVVSGFVQEWVDALAILAIVLLNAVLGFIQELRAEKSLAGLRKLSAPSAKVIRDGVPALVPAREIVPGDLVELEAGDYVPADGRVVRHTPNFGVQEAALTGESSAVFKTDLVLEEEDTPLADRANIVYLGTTVVSGKAMAIIVETGMRSELGRIVTLIQEIRKETTPLQKKLEQFARWTIYLCLVLVAVIFGLELLRGGEILNMFLTAVSLAVAAIPEGLPAVITIALALGVQRMVRRHVLIRKLAAVETLGCATVICSDKTGTLTKNEMTVRSVWTSRYAFEITGAGYAANGEFMIDRDRVAPHEYPDLLDVLTAGVLCNNAHLTVEDGRAVVFGDPTEIAILAAAAKAGIWKRKEEESYELVEELPFDSERKEMSIVRRAGQDLVAFTKGAPDLLLDDCRFILEDGEERPLTKADRDRIMKANDGYSNQALRVLALAYRNLDQEPHAYSAEEIEQDLTFAGLIAMIDPPRPEVRDALLKCRTSGIRTIMITGDHKNTAVAIARELGFYGDDSEALTGDEVDRLGDADLDASIERVAVYARVSPEHKLRAVRALRRRGEIAAMTGDGVNDAPAVKEADIGVAMGITGTDVTKEVSDMVITDDNFASIVAAVEEGRGIYDNIRKFIHFLLSCNLGEILVMFAAALIGTPVPLLPIQILWVNLVTDSLPALALGIDPVDPQIMNRPPRKPDEPLITKARGWLILAQGAFIALCTLASFAYVLLVEKEGIGRARTVALAVLTCSQLFHSLSCRSMNKSLFRLGVFSNSHLVLAGGVSFLLQLAIIYAPFLQPVFKTQALGPADLGLILVFSMLPFWAMEGLKAVNRTVKIYDLP